MAKKERVIKAVDSIIDSLRELRDALTESDDIDSLVTSAETAESAPIDLTPDYPDTDAIKVTISDSVPETSDSELNSDDKAKSDAALMGTVCPACGAPVVGSDSRFCLKCGASLINEGDEVRPSGKIHVKYCLKCGNELRAEDRFCISCGTPV